MLTMASKSISAYRHFALMPRIPLFQYRTRLPLNLTNPIWARIEQRTFTSDCSTSQPQAQTENVSIKPLYTFHDISERDVLMLEMRHHRVSWTAISNYFGIYPMEAWWAYIAAGSKAASHSWEPKMSLKEIQQYLGRSKWLL